MREQNSVLFSQSICPSTKQLAFKKQIEFQRQISFEKAPKLETASKQLYDFRKNDASPSPKFLSILRRSGRAGKNIFQSITRIDFLQRAYLTFFQVLFASTFSALYQASHLPIGPDKKIFGEGLKNQLVIKFVIGRFHNQLKKI